jgi:tripartite-type tricarboxylate transporter receptor subunit TctC
MDRNRPPCVDDRGHRRAAATKIFALTERVWRGAACARKALASPALKEKYAAIGYELVGGTPEQFNAFVKSEIAKWADVVKRSGAKLN